LFEPIGAVSAGASIANSTRGERRRRQGNASNVVFVRAATPRPLHGYELTFEIDNHSAIGISAVAVRVKMINGQLELDGVITSAHTAFAQQAIPSGGHVTLALTHIARLDPRFFAVDDQGHDGYSATLFWRDESGRGWRRTDAAAARSCPAREYPNHRS